MADFFRILKTNIDNNPPLYGDGTSVLTMLYEAYSQSNQMDDAQLKQDFEALYQQMNGMSLQEMDRILDPFCSLCRSHQRTGFIEGVKVGVKLREELQQSLSLANNICKNYRREGMFFDEILDDAMTGESL